MLRKIECYLKPSGLDGLRDLAIKMGIEGMSVTQVRGFGTHSNIKGGTPQFEDRVKVDIVVDEDVVDDVLHGIKLLAGEGNLGAGKIFVIPVEDAVRLSTQEHGKSSIF